MVDRNTITKMVSRLRSESSPLRTGFRKEMSIRLSEKKNISSSKKSRVKQLMKDLTKEDQKDVITSLVGKNHGIHSQIITSLKEVLHNRGSSGRDHEAVRSTVISACCGSGIKLSALSEVLEIYQNRNYHRLKIYKTRRENYMSGIMTNMSGYRYASEMDYRPFHIKHPLTILGFANQGGV